MISLKIDSIHFICQNCKIWSQTLTEKPHFKSKKICTNFIWRKYVKVYNWFTYRLTVKKTISKIKIVPNWFDGKINSFCQNWSTYLVAIALSALLVLTFQPTDPFATTSQTFFLQAPISSLTFGSFSARSVRAKACHLKLENSSSLLVSPF